MQDSVPHLGECCIQVPPQDKVEGLGLHSGVTDIEISMCVGVNVCPLMSVCTQQALSYIFCSNCEVCFLFYFWQIVRHGGCLGLGLAAMGTANQGLER